MSDDPQQETLDRNELIEELAALEHEQWRYWTSNLAERENLSDELVERWMKNHVPYDELEENTKEHDRKWARRVVGILDERGVL